MLAPQIFEQEATEGTEGLAHRAFASIPRF